MAVFKVLARNGSVEMLVRARCLSCAREIAVRWAGREGTRMWRDPALSTVELLRDPERKGMPAEGMHGLIKRIEHDKT